MNKAIWLSLLLLAEGCSYFNPADEARTWAKDMGYAVQGVSCSEVDSDGDGYKSCAVRVEGRDLPIALECRHYNYHGCKLAQPKLGIE